MSTTGLPALLIDVRVPGNRVQTLFIKIPGDLSHLSCTSILGLFLYNDLLSSFVYRSELL